MKTSLLKQFLACKDITECRALGNTVSKEVDSKRQEKLLTNGEHSHTMAA